MSGAGGLAGTMLGVLVAEVANPERFRRGRVYARQHAVSELKVLPGKVQAEVQGSRAAPYAVEIAVRSLNAAQREALAPLRSSPARYTSALPKANELSFGCTCPDWESPCKHAVAVVMELAERVSNDPELLITWRSGPALDASVGDVNGAAATAAAGDDAGAGGDDPPDPLAGFFGDDWHPVALMPVSALSGLSPSGAGTLTDDVAEVVADAIAVGVHLFGGSPALRD